jgi:hypothetical protein
MGYYVYVDEPRPRNNSLQNTGVGALYGLGIGALAGNPGVGAGIGALTGLGLGNQLGSQGLRLPGFAGGKKRSRSKSPKRKSPAKRRKLNSGKKYSPQRKSKKY